MHQWMIIMNIRNKDPFWYFMYKFFKIRKPMPKDLFDFDETYAISDVAKGELEKK